MASPPNLSSPTHEFHYDTTNTTIPQTLWNLRVPLFITRKNNPDSPFITAVPRLSYLAQLLPRLSAFFGVPCSSFHYEEIQLRNLAVGLLVDLYQPPLPWRLEVGDGDEWDIGDTYLNCVKEVSLQPGSAAFSPHKRKSSKKKKTSQKTEWQSSGLIFCRRGPSVADRVPIF